MARDFGTIVKLVLLAGLVLVCAVLGLLLVEKVRTGPAAASQGPGVGTVQAPDAATGARPQAPSEDTDQPVTMKGFSHPVLNEQGNLEAVIIGTEAQWWKKKTGDLYKIVAPLILSSAGSDDGLNLKTPKFSLQAKRADVLVREKVVVYLFEEVKAEAEDFDIATNDVTYMASERRLESDADIVLRKYKRVTDQSKTLEMEVSGKGFWVDMALGKVVILKDPVAKLYNVSRDFLTGDEEGPRDAQSSSDVVITCRGELTYEHQARKVTFADDVVVTYGERTLKCGQLVVALGKNNGKDSLAITDVTASGNVELTYRDQVATGELMQWQSVTQTGLLTGKNAVVRTDTFRLEGQRLMLFRLNSRFHVEGPGRMIVEMADDRDPQGERGNSPAGDGKGLELQALSLDAGKPVEVGWRGSMTYDTTERWAAFQEDVQVRQPGSTVNAKTLRITFGPEGKEVAEVTAGGGVELIQQTEDGVRKSTCEQATWNAAKESVRLRAAEGKTVEILSGGQRLVSGVVIFEPDRVECPAAGSITLPETAQSGADPGSAATKVRWEQSMVFERGESRVGLFKGDVRADRGGEKISSDVLTVHFDTQMVPEKIIASGNAVLEVLPQDASPEGDVPAESAAPGDPGEGQTGRETIGILRPGQGASTWRLSAEEFVIEPATELVHSDKAGLIEFLGNGDAKDTIAWGKKMRISSNDSHAHFEGDVEAKVSGSVLKSQALGVDFDAAGQPHHVKADRQVEFSTAQEDSWQLKCGSAEAVFMAPGRLRQVIARDAVRLADVRLRLRCGTLLLSFDDVEPGGKSPLKHVIARTEVVVNYEDSEPIEAFGDELQWDRADDIYVLTGTPYAQLKIGPVTSRHDRILLNNTTGVITQPKSDRPTRMEVTP